LRSDNFGYHAPIKLQLTRPGMTQNKCLIYAVRYDKERKFISHVKARVDSHGVYVPKKEYTKADIINMINDDFVVQTRVHEYGNSYAIGADVVIQSLNGVDYIKTKPNDTEEDNLGELPIF